MQTYVCIQPRYQNPSCMNYGNQPVLVLDPGGILADVTVIFIIKCSTCGRPTYAPTFNTCSLVLSGRLTWNYQSRQPWPHPCTLLPIDNRSDAEAIIGDGGVRGALWATSITVIVVGGRKGHIYTSTAGVFHRSERRAPKKVSAKTASTRKESKEAD